MTSGPPNRMPDFGHPPSTAPPALGGFRRSATYDSNDSFSAVRQRLPGAQESYRHPHLGSGTTAFAAGATSTNVISPGTAAYTSPRLPVLAPPTSAVPAAMLGHPTPVNPPTYGPPAGYGPSNTGYYNGPFVARPQLPSVPSPASPSISFGHPAMAMAPAADPMAFFGASSSPSGLRLHSPEILDAASRQSNWARKMSASRPPKGKGKHRVRGAANPTPTLGDIPILSATMLSCSVVAEFYPWVNTPGERRTDVFIFTNRLAEFRNRQAAFGAFHIFLNVDFSCPIASLFESILEKMTSPPFHYRFEDLEVVTGRNDASIWERLPFFILVPTNKGTPRTTTGNIHLDILPEFRPLTLGGLTEAKKVKDAASHTIWEERPTPKVPFTARSAAAFTSSVKSTVHQHTCIKARMEFCLTTNNVQEGLPTYRRAQGIGYDFDAGELSSNEESVVQALRAHQGELTRTTLESDRDEEIDSIQAPLLGVRRPEPFPLHIEPPSEDDDIDLPDLPNPTTATPPNLHSQAQTNDAGIAGSSRARLAIALPSTQPNSSAGRTSTTPRHIPINPTRSEASDTSLMDMDIDVPSPDRGPSDDDTPSAFTHEHQENSHQCLFDATPPSLDQLFPRLPRTNDLNDFTTLIPTAAANPRFPNRSEDPLLPAQEAGIDLRAPTVEGLAALLEAAIRQAIESKDFTKELTQEPWKSRFVHHLDVSPVFFTSIPKDAVQAEVWKSEVEMAFVTALTLGTTVSGLEFRAFNNGFRLPCRNGFDLVAAISTYRSGLEVFIRDTWGGLIMSYDSIADKLSFSLVIGAQGPTMETLRNQLRQLDPAYQPEQSMNMRERIIDQLKSYFRRALSHQPSRFTKGLKRLMKEGACPMFDETELANPAFFVRQFHVAAKGSALTLGRGMGDIMVGCIDVVWRAV
ncbi:hypothetical protein FRC01_013680 [Tulasnella sp. 417]|nr:hypothetical protein FRC01_013680 [Tulasnella sp. 417]